MPSSALDYWNAGAAISLDEIVAAHAAVGGSGRGRRFATVQINHAYAVLLSSQFQKFCRDLHVLCVEKLVNTVPNSILQSIITLQFGENRKLDFGNPNPGNIGHDFNQFGFLFWQAVIAYNPACAGQRLQPEKLNQWRNAIAHQDFDPARLGGRTQLQLRDVTRWRRACNGLAASFDEVMKQRLHNVTGAMPW